MTAMRMNGLGRHMNPEEAVLAKEQSIMAWLKYKAAMRMSVLPTIARVGWG